MGIKVSALAQELAQGLSEYSQEVADAIKKATNEVAEEAVQELKSTSPVLTGSYAKGWTKKNTYESRVPIETRFTTRTIISCHTFLKKDTSAATDAE